MLMKSFKHQAGVGMLEILVTLLVLGVGFLGMAALQANALKLGHSAAIRTQASILSYDIIDRMRANKDMASAGNYDITLGDAGGSVTTCETAGCTPAQMATYDKFQWLYELSTQLPRGKGAVLVNAGSSSDRVSVMVQWDESRGEESQTLRSETVEVLL